MNYAAAQLLAELIWRGVRVSVLGDRLHVYGHVLNGERELLRTLKADLVALLAPPCPSCNDPARRIGTVAFDDKGRFACDRCKMAFWSPSISLPPSPLWHDDVAEADYQAVVNRDIDVFGYYRPDRQYLPRIEDPPRSAEGSDS